MEAIRPVRIIVAEDESLILKNIIKKIENISPDFQVVGSAYNGLDALQLLESTKAQILFTDIKMPMMDGLELIRRIREKNTALQIAIISGYDDFEYARSALRYDVADYLLKPVKEANLESILRKMQDTIKQKEKSIERSILSSALAGQVSDTLMPFSFSDRHFMLFLICFGNLKNHISGLTVQADAASLFSEQTMQKALDTCFSEQESWWLIDERDINQKFLIVTANQNDEKEIQQHANALQSVLEKIYTPVSIALCEHYMVYQDIETSARILRNRLYHGLILGLSQVITSESTAGHTKLDFSHINKLSASAKSENFASFSQFLEAQFNQWQNLKCPQYMIESQLLQILRLTENDFETTNEENIAHEKRLYNCIQMAEGIDSLFAETLALFQEIFRAQSGKCTDASTVILEIERFLKKNYASPITVEDMARKYNFNASYLTRIFKKQTGESLVKYLLRLRIDEAKKLLLEHTDLSVKQISTLVGYEDQHYFSRFFKELTGLSPSDYRNKNL
ncbi:helix-turn-helix domain-containing protein [uncultured Robinsoniella sp.]|uniref:response regulator transcription factor n=1 Tax=uncultured Robinsoniella sp. TaxID=904190 RepID=UPI00374E89DD